MRLTSRADDCHRVEDGGTPTAPVAAAEAATTATIAAAASGPSAAAQASPAAPSHLRDEQSSPPTVTSADASIPTSPPAATAVDDHVLLSTTPDAPMTDAAFAATPATLTATTAGSYTTSLTQGQDLGASSPPRQQHQQLNQHQGHSRGFDSDLAPAFNNNPTTLIVGIPDYVPVAQTPLYSLAGLHSLPHIPNSTLNYHYPLEAEDHDLDMSDSDGDAPLHHLAATVASLISTTTSPWAAQSNYTAGNDDPAQITSSTSQPHHTSSVPNTPAWEGSGPAMSAPIPHVAPWATPSLPPMNVATAAPAPPAPTPPQQQESFDPLDILPEFSNPNQGNQAPALGSQNLGLMNFLRHWAFREPATRRPPANMPFIHSPRVPELRQQAASNVSLVRHEDLRGNSCDLQGLDWASMGVTREEARERRHMTYTNYTNQPGSDAWMPQRHLPDTMLPPIEDYFRFRKMNIRQDVMMTHFQLRNMLACPSRTQAFYPVVRGVNCINTVTGKTEPAININGFSSSVLSSMVSAIDANHGVLMAGSFKGEYFLKNLDSGEKSDCSEGQITDRPNGITNHIQIQVPRQSHSPVAVIASNDSGLRVMDLTTEQFIKETMFPCSINHTALSPDGRLRVAVGDTFNVMIIDANTGQVQQELTGHRDYGFACDWSGDGWTVATGFQDMSVKVWDARRWCDSKGLSTPLRTIRSEMAGVRDLRFSPVGSGPRVLVAAEEADFINIIDAQTLDRKQTIDVFGEIGGVAFANNGQDLNVLCCDTHRGGLLQLERCGSRPEPYFDQPFQRRSCFYQWYDGMDEGFCVDEPYRRRPTMTDSVPFF